MRTKILIITGLVFTAAFAACGSPHKSAVPPPTTVAPPPTTQPTPPTTQPTPPTTQPTPPTTTPPTGGTVVCSSKSPPASPKALCGPYSWPADSGNDGTNTYVGSDGWNNQPGETYDLQVVNPGDWTDTVTAAPCQCVSAYPSVEQYGPNNPLKVSAYTKITSTYAEAMNANSASVTHAAYDIWTGSSSNLFADETMIMNDRTASDPGCDSAILASPTFTEPSTGHQVTYDFCQSGSERQFIEHGNERAGSVDILAMFKWMEANGHLPATDLFGEVDYGWEVLSTGSRPQPFHLSGFSLTVLPTP